MTKKSPPWSASRPSPMTAEPCVAEAYRRRSRQRPLRPLHGHAERRAVQSEHQNLPSAGTTANAQRSPSSPPCANWSSSSTLSFAETSCGKPAKTRLLTRRVAASKDAPGVRRPLDHPSRREASPRPQDEVGVSASNPGSWLFGLTGRNDEALVLRQAGALRPPHRQWVAQSQARPPNSSVPREGEAGETDRQQGP